MNAVLSLMSVYTLNDSNLGHGGIAAALSIFFLVGLMLFFWVISYHRRFLKLDVQLVEIVG